MAARKSLLVNSMTRYLYPHIKNLFLLVCFPTFNNNKIENKVEQTGNIVTVALKGVP